MSPCYWRQHWRQRNWRRNDALDKETEFCLCDPVIREKSTLVDYTNIWTIYLEYFTRNIIKTYTHSKRWSRIIHEKSSGFEKKKWISRNVLPDHVHYIKKAVAYVSPFQRRVLLRVISPKHHVRRVKRVSRIICIRRIGVWVKK